MPIVSRSGGGPLGGHRKEASAEAEEWLARNRTWAVQVVVRFSMDAQDVEDVVQEGLTMALIHWGEMEAAEDVAEEVARRRWVVRILFNTAGRYRSRRKRAEKEVEVGEVEVEDVGGSPREVVSAVELLGKLRGATTAARWRVWVAHEVDGVPVGEIARQEGCPAASIYSRIQDARDDLGRAVLREGLAVEGPAVRREGWGTRR